MTKNGNLIDLGRSYNGKRFFDCDRLFEFLPFRHMKSNIGVFKVINPQVHILDDGKLFPFLSSTGLHAEWPVFALDHVPREVSEEVQVRRYVYELLLSIV